MSFEDMMRAAFGDPDAGDFAQRISDAFADDSAPTGVWVLPLAYKSPTASMSGYEAGHRGFRPDGTPVTAADKDRSYANYLAIKARHEQREAPPGTDVRSLVQNTLTAGSCPWWG